MFTRAGQPSSCILMLYVGEGSKREQCHLLISLLAFSHFLHYPQANWALLVLIPGCGLVYVLGSSGSLQRTLLFCWGWEFPPPPQFPQIFTARGFEALFPCAGTLGCVVCLAPQLFLSVYLCANVGLSGPPAAAWL